MTLRRAQRYRAGYTFRAVDTPRVRWHSFVGGWMARVVEGAPFESVTLVM